MQSDEYPFARVFVIFQGFLCISVPSPKKVKSPMVRASPMSPSPVKSPLKGNPSPISNASPCIIDDDLMDEALGVPS